MSAWAAATMSQKRRRSPHSRRGPAGRLRPAWRVLGGSTVTGAWRPVTPLQRLAGRCQAGRCAVELGVWAGCGQPARWAGHPRRERPPPHAVPGCAARRRGRRAGPARPPPTVNGNQGPLRAHPGWQRTPGHFSSRRAGGTGPSAVPREAEEWSASCRRSGRRCRWALTTCARS